MSTRRIATLNLLQASSGLYPREEVDCLEAQTTYKYFTSAPRYAINNLTIVQTSAGGDSRWLGVSGRFRIDLETEIVTNIYVEDFQVDWLYELDAFVGYNYVIVLVLENGTKYRYYSSLPSVPINGTSVRSTVNGGSSRWIGIEGQYIYGGIIIPPDNPNPNAITVVDESTEITGDVRKFIFQGATISSSLTNPKEVTISVTGPVVSFSITSFTNNRNSLEKGQSVGPTGTYSNIQFNWAFNMDPDTSQDINNGVGNLTPLTARSVIFSPLSNITTDTNYMLTAIHEALPYTSSTALSFKSKRYWGVSLSDDPILAGINTYALLGTFLDTVNEELASTRQTTKTFDCSAGRYFYFFFPTAWGTVDPQVQMGSFPQSLIYTGTIVGFTNQSGYTEDYYVYRSDNILYDASVVITVL